MAVGGSIHAITLNGREFSVAADAEAQRKLGGFENEVQANGDGSARLIKTRVPLMIDGLTVEIDDLLNDQEFLQDLQDLPDYFPITIEYASGAIFDGTAQVTGEVQFNNQNATASVSLAGPGRLTRQS